MKNNQSPNHLLNLGISIAMIIATEILVWAWNVHIFDSILKGSLVTLLVTLIAMGLTWLRHIIITHNSRKW